MHSIILNHAVRYPLMEPRDIVKLLFQNTFGGEHMIPNAEESLARLKAEYKTVVKRTDIPLFEDIGNGLFRLHLAAVNLNEYSLERINQAFIQSANSTEGTQDEFIEKLTFIKTNFHSFPFLFSAENFQKYVSEYARAGYPAVSHSESYRNAYHPSYRVIRKSFLE